MSYHNPPSRTLNPAANSRFGLGSEESGLSAPLLTISGVVIQTPRARHAGHASHGMPFGLSPYSTAPYGNIGTVMTGFPPPPMGTSLYASALGALDKDAKAANKCAKEHKPLREKLAASMNVIIRTLGYNDPSQEHYRCYFRLGESLARADKNIAALKWGYAGPSTNEPDKKGQEGTDFRSADNSKKKALGHQGRIEAEKSKSSGTGRMCQMSNLLKSTISVCDILATQFTGKSKEECRSLFSGMMKYYLSTDPKAAAWAAGMAFLPAPVEYTPPEALGGVKKAGLKKEKGFLGIAQGAAKKAVTKSIEDALSSKKRPKDAQPAEAFSQMPADALAPADSSGEAPVDAGAGAPLVDAGAGAPPADAGAGAPPAGGGSKTGLIAIAAAAIGAYFIMRG